MTSSGIFSAEIGTRGRVRDKIIIGTRLPLSQYEHHCRFQLQLISSILGTLEIDVLSLSNESDQPEPRLRRGDAKIGTCHFNYLLEAVGDHRDLLIA
jgi:hypothetical protein